MIDNNQFETFDKEKQRTRDRVKRFIFKFDNEEHEMLLINIIKDESNVVYVVISSIEDFVQSANKSLEE